MAKQSDDDCACGHWRFLHTEEGCTVHGCICQEFELGEGTDEDDEP